MYEKECSYLIAGSVSDNVRDALSGLQNCVEELVKQGYSPIGGVSVVSHGTEAHAIQAMFIPPPRIELAH